MDAAARFAFGQNWADYAKTVGDDQLQAAIVGLNRLLPDGFDPQGKSFLDIGSGSGPQHYVRCMDALAGLP